MHLPKFNFLYFLILSIISIIILNFLLSISSRKKIIGTNVSTPTPFMTAIPTQPNVKIYTDSEKQLKLIYPSEWSQAANNDPYDKASTFIFTAQNVPYHFHISPPGQINPEEVTSDTTVQQQDVVYSGISFTQSIWSAHGIAFYIAAVPKGEMQDPHVFSMELPPQDTDRYISQFKTIMASLKIQ